MGRIRPTAGPELDLWSEWEAIQRNVWLWRETNSRLCDMRDESIQTASQSSISMLFVDVQQNSSKT